MTDQELQLGLVKLLPEKIRFHNGCVRWEAHNSPHVTESEWLHIVWLVEQKFDGSRDASDYAVELKHVIASNPPRGLVGDFRFVNASWQQRATAILKIKPPPPQPQAG